MLLIIHSGEKSFKCETCEKGFRQLANLKAQDRVHTSEKPFKCETCEKQFKTTSNLRSHEKIPSG